MKTFFSIAAVLLVLLLGSVWWSKSSEKMDPDTISITGIHWHPKLEVYVNGEKQKIPPNIGIGPQYVLLPNFDRKMGMTAIHTHADVTQGIIHLEFNSAVHKNDIKLSRFFEIWGKDFRDFGKNAVMTVNGIGSAEFENYIMRDKDKIILRYSN